MGNNATTLNGLSDSSWSSSDFPIPLRSLWALVVSFPALWDWVRLFLFGGLLESARRLLWSLYNYVAAQFVFTVTFDQNDATYRKLFFFCIRGVSNKFYRLDGRLALESTCLE